MMTQSLLALGHVIRGRISEITEMWLDSYEYFRTLSLRRKGSSCYYSPGHRVLSEVVY
jgi:hypothetical protein